MEFPAELAQRIWEEGAILVVLGAPKGTCFGIDFKSWNTEAEFRGFKMIPPGLHYVHYSACYGDSGEAAPRVGYLHNFQRKELVVKMWDKEKEDLSDEVVTQETADGLRANICNIDTFLAPYPFEIYKKWRSLVAHITAEVIQELTPENGKIRSALELISCNDENRPRGEKKVEPKVHCDDVSSEPLNKDKIDQDEKVSSENNSPSASLRKDENVIRRRSRTLTVEQKEQELLPHLQPSPGSAIRFSEFPEMMYPPNSTPAEITKHCLDKTYVLDVMMRRYSNSMDILGELEFAYICFLIGHSLDAFESWKKIVHLFCSCEEAISTHRSLYSQFIITLQRQLFEIPEEFLADIVMNENFIYIALRNFFKTVQGMNLEPTLKSSIDRFRSSLTGKFTWNFSHLDTEDGDEAPVIVDLDQM